MSAALPGRRPAAPGSPAVTLKGVRFRYSDGLADVLRDVGFIQNPGEVIGVIGASAAGKSTLAKCLNRIVPAFHDGDFEGVVEIDGSTLANLPVSHVAATVGMVFQDFETQIFSTNVAHEVAFAMEQAGMARDEMRARIGPALAAVGLVGFEHRDPTNLSGGEKQRLAIAAVLALRPRVIVMDEPTTDLDPEGRAEVFALIRQLRGQGLTLIVIEHELEELRLCDRILMLRDGEMVADGPPAEVMGRTGLLEESGLRQPGLNQVIEAFGCNPYVTDIDHAEVILRERFPSLPRADVPDARLSAPATGTGGQPLLEIRDVRFSYAGGPAVLDGIDLSIGPGEFVALIGQNGSGKTTLAKHIVGLVKPTSGRIVINGRDRAALRPAQTAAEVGYVFQNPDQQIFAATVLDEVCFGPRNFGLPEEEVGRVAAAVLKAVGLEAASDRDPFLLSKGERQRLAVAGVLALRPRLLILDEPTTGLDYREQLRMMALINELNLGGIAILMITHAPWLVAEHARRVIMMGHGRKLFDGPVREFFADPAIFGQSSFRPPEVTILARRFGALALSPAELVGWIRERV